MNSHQLLFQQIEKKISLTETDKESLKLVFLEEEVKKNDFLVRSGSTARSLFFLVSGYIRCFIQDELGNEITTELVASGNLITAFESFSQLIPSSESVQCLTPCLILKISKKEYEKLFSVISSWDIFCRSIYESKLIRDAKRKNMLQSMVAKERYQAIVEQQPELALNIPVKYLASYLGIQPQSLSRIRKDF